MKQSMIILTALAAVANGASHARKCTTGCAHNSCDKDAAASIVTTYDAVVAANKGTGSDGTSLHAAVAQGSTKHVPFICKVTTGRRLAAHVAGKYRVAVAGTNGDKTALHPMTQAHWIDYIQVVDASADSGRRLAAHAKTLLYLKGWQSDGVAGTNAGFDFNILKADKVTHIKAAEHCNLHGLWWSSKIAIADIPVCTANMASANDASRRELAGHAGKFATVANGANPCPTSPAPAPAANAPSPGVKSDASTTSSVGNVLKAAATVVLGLFL